MKGSRKSIELLIRQRQIIVIDQFLPLLYDCKLGLILEAILYTTL
jgi:hypothetical protein